MVDGIDGSGKSSIIEAWENHLLAQGKTVFDLNHYCREKKSFPTLDQMRASKFIFSCEPTRVGIGRVLREELTSQNNNYANEAIAQAFSLDRLILYKKFIIPLLEDGHLVITDRGVSTSLAYQTLPGSGLNYTDITQLPGNALALKYRPDHLIIAQTSPEQAATRLAGRENKKDHSIFEKLETLTTIANQYTSPAYQNIFKSLGTQIHYLPTSDKIDIMRAKAIDLLTTILKA